MIQVSDIYEDAQNIVGTCDDPTLFRRINEAVEALANKGDFDPLLGEMDICTQDACVTLPREIENVLAVNIAGHPTIGRDRWFNFHINGPGDCGGSCSWSWRDGAESSVFRELRTPSKLIAFVAKVEDQGKELRVFGYNVANEWIRSLENGVWKDGYRVPTLFGYALPEASAPLFARIVRVTKVTTVGMIRLTSLDISADTGVLIGQYDYDETAPLYRRISLSRHSVRNPPHAARDTWVRVAFRRRVFRVTNLESVIPLHSVAAILEMMRAFRAYANDNLVLGQGHEVTADRLITEEQNTRTPPVTMPMQVNPVGGVVDNWDQID